MAHQRKGLCLGLMNERSFPFWGYPRKRVGEYFSEIGQCQTKTFEVKRACSKYGSSLRYAGARVKTR
jgi:hypothetical protein